MKKRDRQCERGGKVKKKGGIIRQIRSDERKNNGNLNWNEKKNVGKVDKVYC